MKSDEQRAKDLYNQQKEIYGQGSIAQMNIEVPAFLEALQENPLFKGDVLDVGVGTGQLTRALLTTFSDAPVRLSGFDISNENIAEFTELKNSDPRIAEAVTASFYDIPYNDSSFDLAISNHVLHYAEDVGSALKEIRRVMRKDSYFLLSSVVSESTDTDNVILGALVHEKIGSPIHVWAFQRSKEDILQAFNSSGFLLMPFDNGSYFREFWPSYYYYRSERPNTRGATPHTFFAAAQAVETSIAQTWENSFSESEFKVQVNKTERLLENWGYEIKTNSRFAMPFFYTSISNARGSFSPTKLVAASNTTYEDRFYFLLNAIAHIAQWKADPAKLQKSYHFQETLKTTKDLAAHYDHKLDSIKYLLDFMLSNGLERYILWYLKYFSVDQKYIADYIDDVKEDIDFEYFQKLLKEKVLLEVPDNSETLLLRKTAPDLQVGDSEGNEEPIYFI